MNQIKSTLRQTGATNLQPSRWALYILLLIAFFIGYEYGSKDLGTDIYDSRCSGIGGWAVVEAEMKLNDKHIPKYQVIEFTAPSDSFDKVTPTDYVRLETGDYEGIWQILDISPMFPQDGVMMRKTRFRRELSDDAIDTLL